ncbi:Glutathione peroxidase @ Thioredoxin peroxidase [hydrothermal vent metagenome]|uniref:Glutathione peroxidase @ Thioredoxin peroxidase n=1 Tax=hydrothermal vent metagenome TaxID=652676 RepID=A0A3B1AF59_9ZZZZ
MTWLLALLGCQQKTILVKQVDSCPETLHHTVRQLNDKKEIDLCAEYKGKVLLIVNTASKCAFTGQYEDLENIYAKYKDQGFAVLGFPSNDFANQEPGDEKQVQEFCRLTYGVKFPMFAKSKVKKQHADPVFKTLGELSGTYPKWNFYKFLLDRDGNIVDTYSSLTNPSSITDQIESLLQQGATKVESQ